MRTTDPKYYRPERRRVVIPSEGCDRATLHTYVGNRLEPDPELGDLSPQYALIFRCEETGAERTYGVIDARVWTEA